MEITVEQLQEVFKSAFNTDKGIGQNTSKENLSEWDSIGHLNLIIELEDKFGVSFTKTEMDTMNSVSDIINLLKQK